MEDGSSRSRMVAQLLMKVSHNEGLFKTADGLILFEQSWQLVAPSRGAVVIVHGYAEHSDRYSWLADVLTTAGYSVYSYDQRGHGKSEGLRAFFPKYKVLLDDLERFLATVREKESRIFLLGQSMGGGILANYAALREEPIDGLILCSAMLKVRDYSFLTLLFSRLGSALLPGFPIPEFIFKLEPTLLSRLSSAVNEYVRDPFVYHGPLLNRTGWELNQLVNQVQKNMSQVTAPLLLLHGDADQITDPQGSQMLYERAQSEDKTIQIYPGAYHELFHEEEREAVADLVVSWLNTRSQAPETEKSLPGDC